MHYNVSMQSSRRAPDGTFLKTLGDFWSYVDKGNGAVVGNAELPREERVEPTPAQQAETVERAATHWMAGRFW